MSDADRERWNARWRERTDVLAPSSWLVSLGEILPRAGRALDVAGGVGRHAIWLARRGLDVTLVDVSDEALRRAAAAATAAGVALTLREMDLEHEPLPSGPWDLIVCIHYLQRSLFPAFAAALSPGGLLAFCQQTRKNLERNPHPGPAFLLAEAEAPTLIGALDLVSHEEGWRDGRHESRLLARCASSSSPRS